MLCPIGIHARKEDRARIVMKLIHLRLSEFGGLMDLEDGSEVARKHCVREIDRFQENLFVRSSDRLPVNACLTLRFCHIIPLRMRHIIPGLHPRYLYFPGEPGHLNVYGVSRPL